MSPDMPCPVCAGATRLFDVVDFRIGYPESSHPYDLSGQPVYYAQCTGCAYLFAPEFQRWTRQDFAERIYNADYAKLDPDFADIRPRGSADMLCQLFAGREAGIRHVDYGGGEGRLGHLLNGRGWNSSSWDPFMMGERLDENRKFDLITAFEVFEHVVDVGRLAADLVALLDEPGLILFSTLPSDGHLTFGRRIDWWYVSPISGHIGIHSRRSLEVLGQRMGLRFGSLTEGVHCYFRTLPGWARHLMPPG